jgi:hypothetical protein
MSAIGETDLRGLIRNASKAAAADPISGPASFPLSPC